MNLKCHDQIYDEQSLLHYGTKYSSLNYHVDNIEIPRETSFNDYKMLSC